MKVSLRATTKGYFKIKLDGVADTLPRNSARRTGEQRLTIVEKELTRQGVQFVEDFDDDNTVIVRYGEYINDELFDAEVNGKIPEMEPIEQ